MKRETVVDGEGMLNYLKYSHLDSSTVISIERANKSTLKPLKINHFNFQKRKTEQRKQSIQKNKKLIRIYTNDLNEPVGDYILHTSSRNVDRTEKMVPARTEILKGTSPKSPPSSTCSDNEGVFSIQ